MTDHQMMTCVDVDSVLLEYLEETLDGATRIAVDEHVAGCLRCNAMMRDIASIRSEASRLPELAPSRELWPEIAARIEPAVVPLGRTPQTMRRSWIPAAAAAAVLVFATAGITYIATSRSLQPSPRKVAVVAGRPQVAMPDAARADSENTTETSGQPAVAPTAAGQSTARKGSSAAALASRPATGPVSAADIAYGDEIARLQNIITEKRRQLDPATVAVIEESLKIIDAAVRQSRAALARDPKSGFLADQLNQALDKKIELLRTVALLPSRT